MTRLAPNLFDRRFDDLLEGARSRLPSLAPRWTDYNEHDPGITLTELLAFVAEAQLYSLARSRTDERAGYAALFGQAPRGPLPATGLLWPDHADPDSPFLNYRQPIFIENDAAVHTLDGSAPPFHPSHRLLWVAGRILALRSRLADGRTIDLLRANAATTTPFAPFGSDAGPRDALELEYQTLGDQGLFPTRRALAANALWSVGVRTPPLTDAATVIDCDSTPPAHLSVELRIGNERFPLPVAHDTTRGLMRTGVLLLDVSAIPGSPTQFTLVMRATRGFARPPMFLKIEPGVLPIEQSGQVKGEAFAATGREDQAFELGTPGLRFGEGAPAVRVIVNDDGDRQEWRQVPDLSLCSPIDRVYRLDARDGRVVLGNGINGYLPAAASPVAIDYSYCSGASGNAPRTRRWTVLGINGPFGLNPDPMAGGADADVDLDLRRAAREQLRSAHALVTAADIEQAARALVDLQVARAEVVLLPTGDDPLPRITLVALRRRADDEEPATPPETARWLAAIKRALLSRIPLGTRLHVTAPLYRTFTLSVLAEATPRSNPEDIKAAIGIGLQQALALTSRHHQVPRAFGVPVSRRDLTAVVRAVPGVRRVISLALRVDGAITDVLTLLPLGLPRLDLQDQSIEVTRPAAGAAA